MTILEYVKRYTDNLTTRKIRIGPWFYLSNMADRNIKKLELRKSSGYFRLCDASLEQ